MADADNKQTSQDQADAPANQGNKLDQQLADIAKMLAAQNEQFQQGFNALAEANRAKAQPAPATEDVDPTYNPQGFRQAVQKDAEAIAAKLLRQERELNTTIYNMSQDYPEISTDSELKKMITEAQRTLPENMRETALGYETAILKAVHKKGLLPKSKRQSNVDEDVSMGSGRGTSNSSSRSSKSAKISEETLAVAQLLGRDINDPQVLKGLEAASKRTRWGKYE